MSASVGPIPLDRFAEAITDLPLGNIYAKAAELRNSIAHLQSSNVQLREYADEGDHECVNAVRENNEVIERMELRIVLLKNEMEKRGFLWGKAEPVTVNGQAGGRAHYDQLNHIERLPVSEENAHILSWGTQGDAPVDTELARTHRHQQDEQAQDDDDDGIYL
ncbi:MAG: hypothetical protein Q9219_005260 [cf. Caloplaca sp. 3 TL-2023]